MGLGGGGGATPPISQPPLISQKIFYMENTTINVFCKGQLKASYLEIFNIAIFSLSILHCPQRLRPLFPTFSICFSNYHLTPFCLCFPVSNLRILLFC